MNDNSPIGFGIVGVGMIAAYHARAIQAASAEHNLRLLGVVGLDADNVQRFAAEHHVPFHTTDIDALLRQPGLQVVCIATPSGAHLEPAHVQQVRNEVSHEIVRQSLSAARARNELGWRPIFSLDEGLLRTIEWYRAFLGEAA